MSLGKYGTLNDIELEGNIIFNGFSPFDSGYFYADPLFVNPDTIEMEADFRLQSGSPAIGEGVANEWLPQYDFAGNPIDDGEPDIGALQYTVPVYVQEYENINFDVYIFPNPATNVVHIQLTGSPHTAIVSVHDLQGRKVLPAKVIYKNDKLSMDVSAWPRGIYLVRLQSGQYQKTRKIGVL
jgi:hypothetical protein